MFALAVVAAGFLLGNRILFDLFSAAGVYCAEEATHDAHAKFRTDAVCWSTGFELKEGRQYRIQLTTDGNWFDKTDHTDVEGFSSKGRHYAAALLKRWWSENWFKPIARIGRLGNDEYALNPVDPLEPYIYCIDPELFGQGFGLASPAMSDFLQAVTPTANACNPAAKGDAGRPLHGLCNAATIERCATKI